MILQEIKRALFPLGTINRAWSSIMPKPTVGLSPYAEPTPEIRAAVLRRRRGQPDLPPEHSGSCWTGPASYDTYPVHRRASSRSGVASSDALVVTRFLLSRADEAMTRLIGETAMGRSVLDFELRGLELAWHSDLMRALEDRAAIWSVSRIKHAAGDMVVEHIAMPCRTQDGNLAIIGWYHRIGGDLDGDLHWSEVVSVAREQRGQRISGCLPVEPLLDVPVPPSEPRHPDDVVMACRAKGGL